jgi:hypothetical protein
MTAHDERDVETVAEVLRGIARDDVGTLMPYWLTTARAVLDALDVPGIERRARAEALRDAADKWQWGQWADVLVLKPPTRNPIDNAQRVTDWLRHRAATLSPEAVPDE